jgi:hypothetical protein
MKKEKRRKMAIVIVVCLICLMFSAGLSFAEPVRSEEPKRIDFSKTGIVMLLTDRASMTLQLNNLLRYGEFPTSSGAMLLLLSPHEYVEFEQGELTGYFCGEEFDRRCRAGIEGGQPLLSMGGLLNAGGVDVEYDAKFFRFGKNMMKIKEAYRDNAPPYTLFSIDGRPVKIVHKNGSYQVVCNKSVR